MTDTTHYTGQLITTPGRFEGEPDYIEYYYDLIMDGGGDDTIYADGLDDPATDVFFLDADDPAVTCGDAHVGDVLCISTTTHGFVECTIVTRAEYDAEVARLARD